MITYGDILTAGLPLSAVAKACGLSHVKDWKTRGIPAKYQRIISNLLDRHTKKIIKQSVKLAESLTESLTVQNDIFTDSKTNQENSNKINDLSNDLRPQNKPFLANNRKTAVSCVRRGFQPTDRLLKKRPDLTLLQSLLLQKIDNGEILGIKNIDALAYAQNENAEVKRPVLEYYFLSSVVRKVERGIKVESFKNIRFGGGVLHYRPDIHVDKDRDNKIAAANCGRRVMPQKLQQKLFGDNVAVGAVDIIRCNETVSYHGLMVCKDVWGCPTCSRKISERRKNGLSLLLNAHVKKYGGGSVCALLFTIPHGLGSDLDDIRQRMLKAWRFMVKDTGYRHLLNCFGYNGTVRNIETTYGKNGFHPHFHALFFFDHDMRGNDVEFLKQELFKLWTKAIIRFDFKEPNIGAFGCQCIPTDEAGLNAVADYFGKMEKDVKGNDINVFLKKHAEFRTAGGVTSSRWATEHELTKWHIKNGGKFSYSMFDLLRGYAIADLLEDTESRDIFKNLWLTYRFAFKGVRQLYVKHHDFKIAELLLGDEQVADMDAKDVTRETLASIDFYDWIAVLKCNARGALHQVADKTNGVGVPDFINLLHQILKDTEL